MKKRKRKTKSQKWWGFLKFQMVLIVLVIAAVAYYYAGGYAAKIKEMKTEAVNLVAGATRDTFRQDQTSIAYDCKGETLSVLKGEKDAYYVEYDDIPIYIKQAIVSTEDKRFFKHKGLDYKGILRAIVAMIRDGEVTQGEVPSPSSWPEPYFCPMRKPGREKLRRCTLPWNWRQSIPKRISWSFT